MTVLYQVTRLTLTIAICGCLFFTVVYRLLTSKTTVLNLLCYICIGKRKINSWQPKYYINHKHWYLTLHTFHFEYEPGEATDGEIKMGFLQDVALNYQPKSMQMNVIFSISTINCCIVEIGYRDNFTL